MIRKISAAALILFSSVVLSAQSLPSCWINSEQNAKVYADAWTSGSNEVKASVFGEGILSTVNNSGEITFGIERNRPTASLKEGDWWLLTFPLEKDLEKGSYIEIDFTMVSQPRSPKYYIVEILDGKKWKSDPEQLRRVPENPALFYSVRCSGYGTGSDDQHSMHLQTFKLEKGAKGSVQLRIRAVGPYTCWGDKAKETDQNYSSFVDGPSSAIYCQNLGTVAPKDTTKILCIGNSFTYVNGPVWMLKELAWSQGHFLDAKVAQKGGQSLGQHIHLGITAEAIERDSYDYIFLQDQSQNCAKYGKDSFINRNVLDNSKIIASWIRKHSPDCKIFNEMTWAYSGGNYASFGSFEKFDQMTAKGAREIAQQIGSTVSPIAMAFAISRNERPDINLYYSDNLHQSEYGAYLKACVNYLMMFGGDFDSNAASCSLDPEKASFLRQAAKRAVAQNK